jgi:uncharacterized protein (TIGR02611 family)
VQRRARGWRGPVRGPRLFEGVVATERMHSFSAGDHAKVPPAEAKAGASPRTEMEGTAAGTGVADGADLSDTARARAEAELRAQALTIKRRLRKVWVLIAGTVIIITGIVISPLPGPGFTVLGPLGLALIATEFAWARRLLVRLRERSTLLTDQTDRMARYTHPVVIVPVVAAYWVLVWLMAEYLGHGWGGKIGFIIWAVSFPAFTPVMLWAWATVKFWRDRDKR